MLSGFIIIALTLAAFSHVNAVPYQNALLKMLANTNTVTESSVNHGGKISDAREQQFWLFEGNGISAIECPHDILQINPTLNDLQRFKSDFIMEVDCSAGQSVYCTDLWIEIETDKRVRTSRVCYSPSSGKRFHTCTCMYVYVYMY